MMIRITRAFVLLFALSTLILQPSQIFAQDVDLSVSAQIKGLRLEFPMSFKRDEYIPEGPVFASIQFGSLLDRYPTPTPVVQTTMQLSKGGLNADQLFDMSNAHRLAMGLPPFQKEERACRLALKRAPEIAAEIVNGNMHAGMYGRNLPYWNTENIISMRTEEDAFHWWLNDDIHRKAIEGNYTYSCVACHGNNCAQEFTNFQPK
jgi:uncharacterized protein YkwD